MTIENSRLIKVENKDIPKSGEFIIPNDVEIIGEEIFKNFQELKSIIISDSVKKIESKAFKNCKNLKRVSFSNGLEEIGNEAFYGCISLKNIVIPNSVKCMGCGAFESCVNLQTVTLSKQLIEINLYTFMHCQSLSDIVIPDSVLKIYASAFNGCLNLNKVKMSNSIREIDNAVFANCNLDYIDIPQSIIYISNCAFMDMCLNLNIRTSLFSLDDAFIKYLLKSKVFSLIIYNNKIVLDKIPYYENIDAIFKTVIKDIRKIRKKELLDIIEKVLDQNGIISKKNISYREHKSIIDDILIHLEYSNLFNHYDYRSVLNPYLEKYIEVHKPKNMLMQLNDNTNIFQNKSIDDVIKDLKEWKIELLSDNEKYIDIFNYGKGMNEYPLYISSIFYDTVSKYSKDIKIKQIKQVFDKLTSSGKNNLFKKIFFRTNDDNNLVLNKELLEQFNSAIDNEIILASDEIEILNKIKELINNYIGKLQEYISYLDNYSINADNSLDTFSESDELLKGAVKDSKIQDFNHLITSISEKYGQINLVISNNLIYINKLNNIKNSLLPTLLERIIIGDVVAKDIEIVKETMQISKMLEEMIINKENISNNLEDNNELDKDKQLIKKNN